jgi:hypothetical protein
MVLVVSRQYHEPEDERPRLSLLGVWLYALPWLLFVMITGVDVYQGFRGFDKLRARVVRARNRVVTSRNISFLYTLIVTMAYLGNHGNIFVNTAYWGSLGFAFLITGAILAFSCGQFYYLSDAMMRGSRLNAAVAFLCCVTTLVLLFSMVYATMSGHEPASFNIGLGPSPRQLSKLDALYFTLTVLTTTGFGDISPANGTARAWVSAEMVVGIVLFAVVLTQLLALGRRPERVVDN